MASIYICDISINLQLSRVLGPTAVLQLAEREEPPPANARPLYSLAMRGAVICFSGFRKKDELVSVFITF